MAELEIGLRHFTALDPDSVAIRDQQGRTWSRGELSGAANRLSRALRSAGIAEGDCMAILAPNCVEYLQAYLAATQIGLLVVSVNPHLGAAESAHILQDSGAKVLFAHARTGALANRALGNMERRPAVLVSSGSLPAFSELTEFCASQSAAPLEDAVTGRVLTYTSATTGRPKGVDLPLRDAQMALERVIRAHVANGIQLGDANVHLCASMLYHPAPLEWSVIALHMGHEVVLVDHWQPELLLQLIDQYAVTTTFMVPAMFVRMRKLQEDTRRRYSHATLRFVAHGAAPCPVEIKRQMIDWWGPIIWEAYGSSEGSGTVVNSTDWLAHPGTVGRPFPGSRVKILTEAGEEAPPGVHGMVYLTRYTGDRFQYRGDPEKTRAAYRGDFFTVGDIGYMDEGGFLFLCDRKIDMIICGGMNIYPAEIERVLVQHPDVADCAVFGIPDELLGESVKAVIEPQSGVAGGAALTVSIFDFLAKHLSPEKCPRRLEFTTALPRDPNGKIYKRILRNAHWDSGRQQI